MSKEGFFQEALSDLRELAAECLVMDAEDYTEFKCEVMEECDPRAKGFLSAVLSVIDRVRGDRI